ncbi:MAG TPA: hypothetical protein DCL61_05120 [Cyanobacteria bacterium UBA12227]|nr:hypothetical protein [Cyanobacteria bacterium UBA12227]
MVVGCWLLVVSCWLLVVSCWLLVVSCWLLVVLPASPCLVRLLPPLPLSPSPSLPLTPSIFFRLIQADMI